MFLGLFYDECFDQLIQPIVTLGEVCLRRICQCRLAAFNISANTVNAQAIRYLEPMSEGGITKRLHAGERGVGQASAVLAQCALQCGGAAGIVCAAPRPSHAQQAAARRARAQGRMPMHAGLAASVVECVKCTL